MEVMLAYQRLLWDRQSGPVGASTSFPGSLSEKRETLVAAGHVPPRIWVVTKNSLKGGRLRLLLSILSLQESVKCCHQNKHFFHVAPVCCIKVGVYPILSEILRGLRKR